MSGKQYLKNQLPVLLLNLLGVLALALFLIITGTSRQAISLIALVWIVVVVCYLTVSFSIKVQITRLQAEDFALTEREDHAHVHRQMQGGVFDGLQGCQHGFLVPDGALLDVDLGGITGQGNLVDEVPLHRIGKCGLEQRVDFVDRGAGQQPLLLLVG